VHYHSGKANVVADVLSHKAHYNYLSAVCLTGEESSIRVLPDLSLFNIILTPTLRNEIITAQKIDESMGHNKRRMQEGDPKVSCFCEDVEGTLWFKERLVVLKNLPWVEFSYNNSYQESLKMALFKVLYGHRCLTPLNWIELG
jgi:hypothetical protein